MEDVLVIGRLTRFDSFACPDHLPLATYISFLPARDTLEDSFPCNLFFCFFLHDSTSTSLRGCCGDTCG